MFDQLVMQQKHFSRWNSPTENSTGVYFVDIVIDWALIYLKKILLVAFYFLIIACYGTFWRVHVSVHCFGDNINLSCCPWWTVCFSSCLKQITYMTYSSYTTPLYWSKTGLGWLCPDDQITTGGGGGIGFFCQTRTLCLVRALLHSVHLAGTHTDRSTKYDRIPAQAHSSISVLCL